MRIKHYGWMGLVLLTFLSLSLVAQATPITVNIASGAGTGQSNTNVVTGPNSQNFVINPIVINGDVWAPAQGGAQWISYLLCTGEGNDAGCGGKVSVPNDPANPNATFFYLLNLPQAAWITGYNLTLNVFADDTAAVFVDGNQIIGPNLLAGTYCAGGVIGCVGGNPGTGGHFAFTLAPGQHTLSFPTYQVAGDGYGLMFYGTASAVPEPSSLILLGSGLLGGAGFVRRKLFR